MADILIRGMEMPKDGRITIQIGADGAVYFVEECTIMAEKYEKSSYAIPLPAGHGRLGDLDALMPDFVKARWAFFSDRDTFLQLLKHAPTIVPTEGDDN